MPRCCACGSIMARHSSMTPAIDTGSRVSIALPDSISARSRISLISSSRYQPAFRIRRRSRCWEAVGGGVADSISWAKPRMELSGVRSSWLMLERKSVLARLAFSAAIIASLSFASMALCAEMSISAMLTPGMPPTGEIAVPSAPILWRTQSIRAGNSVPSPRRIDSSTLSCSSCDCTLARKPRPEDLVFGNHELGKTPQQQIPAHHSQQRRRGEIDLGDRAGGGKRHGNPPDAEIIEFGVTGERRLALDTRLAQLVVLQFQFDLAHLQLVHHAPQIGVGRRFRNAPGIRLEARLGGLTQAAGFVRCHGAAPGPAAAARGPVSGSPARRISLHLQVTLSMMSSPVRPDRVFLPYHQ